mgnify:CR=1 FL=1
MEKNKFITQKEFLKKYCISNNEKYTIWKFQNKETTNIEVVKNWYRNAENNNFYNKWRNNLT